MKFKLLIIIATLIFCSNIFGQFDLDNSFSGDGFLKANPHTGSNDYAITTAIEKLPNGKYLVSGSALGVTSGRFVMTVQKYNSDGSIDTTFGGGDGVFALDINGLGSVGRGLAIQPDGKIIVAGFSIVAVPGTTGVHRETVVRLNSDGSFDTSFASDGIFVQPHPITNLRDLGTEAYDVELMANGNIVTSGQHKPRTQSQGHACGNNEGQVPPCSSLAIYSSDGTELFRNYFDFGVGSDSEFLVDIEVQTDGKIVGAIGNRVSINDFSVVRFLSNGVIDATFGINGLARTSDFFGSTNLNPRNVELQQDGKILLTGNTNGLISARFNSDGTMDNSYGTGGKTPSLFTGTGRLITGESTVILPNGKILTNGTANKLIRLNSDGSPDNSFGQNGVQTISPAGTVQHIVDMVHEPNGKIAYTSRTTLLTPGQGPVDEWLVGRLTDTSFSQNQAKFDFDGDNKTDIGIFRPAPGEWWYLRSSDGGNTAFQFGQNSDKIVPADFTGDGATDIAFWRESSGDWFILRSEDSSFYSFPFGTSGDIPAPADYDGDGTADPAIFRPSNATWYILNSGGGTTIQQFGLNGDVPIAQDFDGDGKDDLAIFRPSVGEWYYQRSSDSQVNGFQFGASSDKPVPADYTGDGKADIGFFRPNTGEWFILRSEDNSFFAFPFGTNGDIPVPGDYDGDGTADSAVFRPSNNTWFLNQSTDGSAAVQFGIANDIPVPSAYIP